MFKPKQIAPFFEMSPMEFSNVLREVSLVYPLEQTPLGSFLLTEEDLPVINDYIKTMTLFGNKKMVREYLKDYFGKKSVDMDKPDWYYLIQNVS